MNRQVLILMVGGLFAALVVALIVQSIIGDKPQQVVDIATIPTTQVLVAARNITIGDELDTSMVKWQDWPQDALFAGAITRASSDDLSAPLPISGQFRRSIAVSEPITQSLLVDAAKSGNFIASSLREGMRAMAITVNAQSSVAGFVNPGDYVDIILTHSVRLPASDNIQEASLSVVSQTAAQTLLENVRVIAVDQEAKERKEIKLFKTVTIEITPKQAEQLALAQSMGELSLVLRRIGDTSSPEPTKTTTDIRMSRVMQELVGEQNTSGINSHIVRIYNGSDVEEIAVRPYPEQ